MKKWIAVLLLPLALLACSKKEQVAQHEAMMSKPAPPAAAPERKFMAYEHRMEIRVAANSVASSHAKLQDTCNSLAGKCTVLESRIQSGDDQSAHLKMRAAPESVKFIIATSSRQGEVVDMHTSAEDLAEPITDGARKLEMLKGYRGKLEALLARPGNKAEELIQLTKELAETQEEIERRTGSQAKMIERVETEILTIDINGPSSKPFGRPIARALDGFASDLSTGIAGAISALAFLLPSALLLWAVVWGVLKIRRRRKLKAG